MSTKKASFDENRGMGKSKVRKVPDFSKLHHQWNSKLEQRKALGKRPCTIPVEFDVLHEQGTFGRISKGKVTPVSKVSRSAIGKAATSAARKSPGPIKFKASKDALNSILTEEGIRNEVTPPKSYSMYYRAGENSMESNFKTPMTLPKSMRNLTNTTSLTSVAEVKTLPGRIDETEVKFEANREALRGIMNEEGIKKEVATPRHFSMYCRTGQPLNTALTPSNILKSAKKIKAKTPQKVEDNSSHPDVNFEANKDALNSILNEKGISDEASTPKYYSMYCRTGHPLRTPQQSQSVRKSIYYHAATTNGKEMAQKYARQLNLENVRPEKLTYTTSMSAIKSTVSVPIRNSIYKKYCLSPAVKVTPSPRRPTQKPKSAARVRWADVLNDEESKVNDDLSTKLSFDDFESPSYDKENFYSLKKLEEEVKVAPKEVTRSPSIKKFSIFCDKDIKQSPSEQPKKGALCPLSPNVNTPPRSSPRARDLLHHNSPLKAVISNKPRYYYPASPQFEHQVNSATDLINKENMSPKRPLTQDKDVLKQTEMLKDDVQDLNVTLNESVMKYDQLQQEADQLLSADADHNIILMKLEKIRAKQQKLLNMEEYLKRKLKNKQSTVTDSSSKSNLEKNKESAKITKNRQSPDLMEATEVQETVVSIEKDDAENQNNQEEEVAKVNNTDEETSSPSANLVADSVDSLEKASNRKSCDKKKTSVKHKNKSSEYDEVVGLTKHMSQVTTREQTGSESKLQEAVDACHQPFPDCRTPQPNRIMSTPKYKKAQESTDGLVMPTPVRKSPESPTKRAYYYPAICTPLSMRDMAGHSESRRDSLGRSPDTPEDICDSYSIDKSVDSSLSFPFPAIPSQKVFTASPASCASPTSDKMRSPLTYLTGTPMQLIMGSPGSPVTLRGSLSLTGNINFAKPNTPGRGAAGLLLPAAVHRYHDALLDDEVSLYMCRLKRYGNSIYAADARIQDPVAEVLTIGDEMHFIPVSSDDLLLGFSFQPLEGSAFSILKTAS